MLTWASFPPLFGANLAHVEPRAAVVDTERMSTPAADVQAARRRVELWPLRRAVRFSREAAAGIGAILAAALGVWPIAGAALLALAVSVLARRLYSRPERDIADLRTAGPALTPDERARAFEDFGVLDTDEPLHNGRLEDLRRYLRGLPGGIRRRSALALRDPDERVPLDRGFAVRALVVHPLAVAAALVAADLAGVPGGVRGVYGPFALLLPSVLAFRNRRMRPTGLRRRAGWALGALAATLAWVIAAGAVMASA